MLNQKDFIKLSDVVIVLKVCKDLKMVARHRGNTASISNIVDRYMSPEYECYFELYYNGRYLGSFETNNCTRTEILYQIGDILAERI